MLPIALGAENFKNAATVICGGNGATVLPTYKVNSSRYGMVNNPPEYDGRRGVGS